MRRVTMLLLIAIVQLSFAMSDFTLAKVRGGYQFELTLPAYEVGRTTVNSALQDGTPVSGEFTTLSIPGYSANGAVGAPQLLSSTFDIALGRSGVAVSYEVLQMDTIKLVAPLYPKQHDIAACSEGKLSYFSYDTESYVSSKDPVVAIEGEFTYRAQNAATITVSPVAYNAAANELYIAKKVAVSIDADTPALVRSANSKSFDKVMRSKFKNLEGALGEATPSEQFRANEKYLIIAASKYMQNSDLQALIDYRTGDGFDVELVDNSSVGTTKDQYRDFIRGKMPTCVLLVGDDSDFPAHSFSFNMGQMITVKSFSYYICAKTSGEPSPEIAMGLFLVNSDSELKNMVTKTMAAEAANEEMPNTFVGVGGNKRQMGSLKPEHCDQVVQQMGEQFFEPEGYKNVQVYSYLQPVGDKQDIIAACNEGSRFINYNGHGMVNEWVYGWGNSDINSLTNEYYPYVLSCCCYTGTFDQNCMSRVYTTGPRGASAFIASYEQSSMGQHPLNYGLYDAILTKGITQYGLAFVFAANSDIIPTSCQSMPPNQQTTQLMQWQYHLYGDPALETLEGKDPTPTITVKSPNGGETVAIGESTEINWTSSNCGDKVTIKLTGASNETLATDTENDGSFTWDVPEDIAEGNYKIEITCGDVTDASDANFTLKKIKVSGNMVEFGDWYVSCDSLDGAHGSEASLDTSKADEIAGVFTIGTSDDTKNIWPWASLSCEPGNDLGEVTAFKITYKSDKDFIFTIDDPSLSSAGIQYGYKLPASTSFKEVTVTPDMFTQPEWIEDDQKADLNLEAAKSVSFNPDNAYGNNAEICINSFKIYNFKGKVESITMPVDGKTGSRFSVAGMTSKAMTLSVPKAGTYTISVYGLNGQQIATQKVALPDGLHKVGFTNEIMGSQIVILSIKGAGESLRVKQVLTK